MSVDANLTAFAAQKAIRLRLKIRTSI